MIFFVLVICADDERGEEEKQKLKQAPPREL